MKKRGILIAAGTLLLLIGIAAFTFGDAGVETAADGGPSAEAASEEGARAETDALAGLVEQALLQDRTEPAPAELSGQWAWVADSELDSGILDSEVIHADIRGDRAELEMTVTTWSKVIRLTESGWYRAVFPVNKYHVGATLTPEGDGWTVEDLEMLSASALSEDIALEMSFISYEKAVIYALGATPRNVLESWVITD